MSCWAGAITPVPPPPPALVPCRCPQSAEEQQDGSGGGGPQQFRPHDFINSVSCSAPTAGTTNALFRCGRFPTSPQQVVCPGASYSSTAYDLLGRRHGCLTGEPVLVCPTLRCLLTYVLPWALPCSSTPRRPAADQVEAPPLPPAPRLGSMPPSAIQTVRQPPPQEQEASTVSPSHMGSRWQSCKPCIHSVTSKPCLDGSLPMMPH